jgi:hypothetical protein
MRHFLLLALTTTLLAFAAAETVHSPVETPTPKNDEFNPPEAVMQDLPRGSDVIPQQTIGSQLMSKLATTFYVRKWDYSGTGKPFGRLEFGSNAFCKHLDGSYYDQDAQFGMSYLKKLLKTSLVGSPIAAGKFNASTVAFLIDTEALRIHSALVVNRDMKVRGFAIFFQAAYRQLKRQILFI